MELKKFRGVDSAGQRKKKLNPKSYYDTFDEERRICGEDAEAP